MAQLYDANGNPVFSDVVQQSQILGALAATNSIQLRGQACASVQVSGIGNLTLIFEGSTDGSNFDPLLATPIAGGAPVSTTTGNGHWVNISTAGLFIFRVRVSTYVSGNATVSVIASQGSAPPNFSATGQQSINLASVGGTAVTAAVSALGTAPTGTSVEAVNNVALPNASAGAACTLFQNSAVTTAVVVKASAGNIYGFMVNGGTSGNFLQFINAASAPTLGTAAVFSVQIPASGIVFAPPADLAMVNNATGISVGISTTYNGASAGTAAAVIVFYK